MAALAPPLMSASLYVGDLASDVSEVHLFEIFSKIGQVLSIRVCREMRTKKSLGYAYVNYYSPADAKRAIDDLSHTIILGKPCRISWSQRDPTLRKSPIGNLFIKNLPLSVDHQKLTEFFAPYGQIVSSKLVLDEAGSGKNHAFVQFDTQESADSAIEKLNGFNLEGNELYVARFVPKKERLKVFTNVFVKNLEESVTDQKLRELFSHFGNITACAVQLGPDGKSKFGFVNFEHPEDAKKAVEEMNGKEIGGKNIYVGKAMKKSQRDAELKAKFEQIRHKETKFQGTNLYVKGLDEDVDDQKLRAAFSPFGQIASARVMKDEKGAVAGFGFVCFLSPEDANRAINEMNGKVIGNKTLYVAYAQRKDQQQQQQQQHNNQRNNRWPAQQPQGVHRPTRGGSSNLGGQHRPPIGGPGGRRYPTHPIGQGQQRTKQGGPIGGGQGPRHQDGRKHEQKHDGGVQSQAQPATHEVKEEKSSAAPAIIYPSPEEPLTAEALQQFSKDQQATLLGERLFFAIAKIDPTLAPKITGMLLDQGSKKSFSDLLIYLSDPSALKTKIDEATQILKQHDTAQADSSSSNTGSA